MGSDNHQDNLKAAYVGHAVIIRVEGRGSFKISPPLKQFIHRSFDSKRADRVLIDMSQCCTMDSTFMGVLAGLSFQLKTESGCPLKLINLSERNEKLLTTLGVDKVVNYTLAPSSEENELMEQLSPDVETLDTGNTDTLETARTTLAAHEDLVNINPANLEEFKSVLELLQKEVGGMDRP